MGVAMCIRCLRYEEELKALHGQILELQANIAEKQEQIEELGKENALQASDLKRLREDGERARNDKNQPERVHPDQLDLAFERVLAALRDPEERKQLEEENAADDGEQEDEKKRRKRGGRRALADLKLPVIEERIVPPEVQASGGVGWTRIGEDVSDRVVFQPGHFVRVRTIREKWVRCDESGKWLPETLSTAPQPGWVLPGMMADTSLIARILISKYGFALPLHRQERMSEIYGFDLPRSTLSDWTEAAHRWAAPVVAAMHAESLTESYCIGTDATSAPVRRLGGQAFHHLFVFIADAGHITFLPSRRHTGAAMHAMLGPFRGHLLSDAASIYNLVHALGVVFVACWAHVRRYFWKATLTEPNLAYEALALINKVFDVERKAKTLPLEARASFRRERAGPVLRALDEWSLSAGQCADPAGRIRSALTYYANQRAALGRFVEDARLEAHNNACERELRNLVIGRKNWMHFENKTGLEWYAVFRSLISSCKIHSLNPHDYLEEMLRLSRHWPQDRLLELSPKYWRATRESLNADHRSIIVPPWKKGQDPPPVFTTDVA